MKNIEKYEDQIKAELEKDNTLGCVVNKLMGNKCDYYPKCNDCYLKVLDWLLQEYKEPILTDEAKAYLKAILEPIEGCYEICKVSCFAVNVHELIFYNGSEYASLKYKTGTKLYKYFEGLDYDRSYSLEELGL